MVDNRRRKFTKNIILSMAGLSLFKLLSAQGNERNSRLLGQNIQSLGKEQCLVDGWVLLQSDLL